VLKPSLPQDKRIAMAGKREKICLHVTDNIPHRIYVLKNHQLSLATRCLFWTVRMIKPNFPMLPLSGGGHRCLCGGQL